MVPCREAIERREELGKKLAKYILLSDLPEIENEPGNPWLVKLSKTLSEGVYLRELEEFCSSISDESSEDAKNLLRRMVGRAVMEKYYARLADFWKVKPGELDAELMNRYVNEVLIEAEYGTYSSSASDAETALAMSELVFLEKLGFFMKSC